VTRAHAARVNVSRPLELKLGTPVRSRDGVVGTVADVIVEPATKRLTHIVVEDEDKQDRLVPVDLVDETATARGEIALTCGKEEFTALEPIRAFAYLPADQFPVPGQEGDVGVEDVVAIPAYEAVAFGDYVPGFEPMATVTFDRIPKGEAELRRDSDVMSSDEHRLGRVAGFVVDTGRVTHIVLERGHLWGARDVTIPVDSVASLSTDRITLSLTKDEVGALPSVRLHRIAFL
jgi:uncharacterized protein YrrD